MLAVGGELPADDAPWAYEMKWDGIRALAHVQDGQVMLVSRTGRDVSATYPELQGLAEAAGEHQVILDGEIVAFGPNGWPSFEVLQQRMNVSAPSQIRQLAAEVSVSYLAFDVLSVDGESLLDRPYRIRRQRLEDLGLEGPHWQTPPAFIGASGADIRAVSQQHSLEGIMAKRLESRYEPGKRTSSWRKIKNVFRQEVVVGGWKPGEGNRASLIGSLIVGVYDSDRPGLRRARRHRLHERDPADAHREAGAAAPPDLTVRFDDPGAARARARCGVGRARACHRGCVRAVDQLGAAASRLLPGCSH